MMILPLRCCIRVPASAAQREMTLNKPSNRPPTAGVFRSVKQTTVSNLAANVASGRTGTVDGWLASRAGGTYLSLHILMGIISLCETNKTMSSSAH